MPDAPRDVPPGDVVLFATADWDEPYWTNKQHTARTFAQLGWRVLYVESVGLRGPKVASGKDWKRLWRRLWRGLGSLALGPRQTEQNIWIFSPLAVPGGHGGPFIGRLNTLLIQWPLRRFLRVKRWSEPLIWTYHPFMLDLLAGIDRGKLVYHCVDDLGAVPMIDSSVVNAAEVELLKACDAVFVTNENLLGKCRPFNADTHYFPNVVDFDHFSRAHEQGPLPEDLREIPEPRIVYMGVLSDFKVNFKLIFDVALARPDWSWVIIGTEREGQKSEWITRLRTLPNIHFLGRKAYRDLPAYLVGCQVATLPTLCNDYTRSMFPMKFFEYIAAGLRVVATPLPFTSAYPHDGVETAVDALHFQEKLRIGLNLGRLNQNQCETLVGQNTWHERLRASLQLLSTKR
jgi:glycosyltransferase involved in cell wall biosynthesis